MSDNVVSYDYGVAGLSVDDNFTNDNDLEVGGRAVDVLRSARDSWPFESFNGSSAIIDSIDVEMQDITQDGYRTETYIVTDTNILISHLTVLKDLHTVLESNDRSRMPIVLLIPGIVIAELDYQKNCKRGVAFESRKASEWLAREIRSGQGIIKGQAYSQTLLPSGDWRQRAGLSNDELILDCCKYYTRIKQKDVLLCTNDNNLIIQAVANGSELFIRDASVAILRPISPAWSCYQLLQHVIPGYIPPSMHAARVLKPQRDAKGYSNNCRPTCNHRETPVFNSPAMDMDIDTSMDLDSIPAFHPSPQGRDCLHRSIMSELHNHVRRIVGKATHLQQQRRLTESQYSHANMLFRGDLPAEEDWMKNWSIRECLRYLVKVLPPKNNRSHPFEEGDASSLSDFLSLPGERGARPGREWSKTDWTRELVKISQLAQDYDYEGLDSETLHNYRSYVLMVFK